MQVKDILHLYPIFFSLGTLTIFCRFQFHFYLSIWETNNPNNDQNMSFVTSGLFLFHPYLKVSSFTFEVCSFSCIPDLSN